MEYASTAASAQVTQPVPHFEGLPSTAERAELVCDRIQRFLDRFHGASSPAQNGGVSAGLAAVPSGHLGQLRRVHAAIERLEMLTTELDEIG